MADLVQTARSREERVQRQNAFTRSVNDRLSWVLRTATGQVLDLTPDEWWSWWNDATKFICPAANRSPEYTTTKRARSLTSPRRPKAASRRFAPPPSHPLDCLAAGTPVWTIAGPAKIEQIRVGDMVLSQHPETGELAFKPVLKTTVRPAGPLVQIQIIGEANESLGETIQTSGGHPFWVSGEGWVKARQLKSGQVLHGAGGPVSISCVDPGVTGQTYNLVVADFHTYFAGSERSPFARQHAAGSYAGHRAGTD